MKARPSASLSDVQQTALNNEIDRQIKLWKDSHLTDYELATFWTLHHVFGFGKDRLKRFFDTYEKVPQMFEEKYDGIGTVDFIAHQELMKIGVNLYEWRNQCEKEN